ncbi:hypothetical protein BKA62DRAFT_307625 [Auriculariales sp. MPI-PUGE-AT-0066]|nr:hypothetical protein BKA62DRAFT_307625 [Auriculariales sp. MPI-PUGE-AT-0066]
MNRSHIIFLLLTQTALAAFSGEPKACWQRNCIIRNDAGTICLEADYNGIAPSKCADPFLQTLIEKHHDSRAGRSISYYDDEAGLLGAATWRVPSPLGFPVFVCMMGQRVDDPSVDRTICRGAMHDDDMEDHHAHVRRVHCRAAVDSSGEFVRPSNLHRRTANREEAIL